MRVWCVLSLILVFCFATTLVMADIKSPTNSPIAVAPKGYEPQPPLVGAVVPFGPCALFVDPGAIAEDVNNPGGEDPVFNDFVDTSNDGCNAATPEEAKFTPGNVEVGVGGSIQQFLADAEVYVGHAFTYFGGPEIPDNTTGLAYNDGDLLLYGVENGVLYSFDPTMLPDAGTMVGDTGATLNGLTNDGSGNLIGVGGSSWVAFSGFDPATAAATDIGLSDAQAIAGPNGDAEYIVSDGNNLHRVSDAADPAGSIEDLGAIQSDQGGDLGVTMQALFFAPDPNNSLIETLFGIGDDDNTYTITNANPPVATLRGPAGIPHSDIQGGAYDGTSGVAYAVDSDVNEIDTVTLEDGDLTGSRTQARDTDWFALPIATEERSYRWSVRNNLLDPFGMGPVNLFIIQDTGPVCTASADIVAAVVNTPGNCQDSFVQFVVQPGEQYYGWIGANGFTGFEWDGDLDHNLWVGTFDDNDPVDQCVQIPIPDARPLWTEDFDDYVIPAPAGVVNVFSAPENDALEPWDLASPPGLVVNGTNPAIQYPQGGAHTGDNLLLLGGASGDTDVVRRLCDVQQDDIVGSSVDTRQFYYVPQEGSSGDAYHIELSDYEHGGAKTWAHQTHMRTDGTVDEEIHGIATGVYNLDQWIEICINHNLDANEQQLLIDGAFVGTSDPFPWTDTPATGINFECIDYFSSAHTGFFSDTFELSEPVVAGSTGIRGDFNGDGVFNGLVDGLGILNFFFIPGSPGTPCEDAADANGDGVLNGLVDGLGILNVAFIPGTPPLPAPFPNCGQLPDNLGCANPVACP